MIIEHHEKLKVRSLFTETSSLTINYNRISEPDSNLKDQAEHRSEKCPKCIAMVVKK
jgi:hypothetical protein